MMQGLMLIVGLIGCALLVLGSARAAIFTVNSTADTMETPLQVQWCDQDLQYWRQQRDVVDYQIADIDVRLKDPKLTEADRKALEDQKQKFMQDRNDIDWWIKWIFERLIHGACDAHNTGSDLEEGKEAKDNGLHPYNWTDGVRVPQQEGCWCWALSRTSSNS